MAFGTRPFGTTLFGVPSTTAAPVTTGALVIAGGLISSPTKANVRAAVQAPVGRLGNRGFVKP